MLDELGRRPRPTRSRPSASPNQRETVVAWDRRTGAPLPPGHRLAGPPHRRPLRRARRRRAPRRWCATRTGLVLDPYFSATKMEWLLDRGRRERRRTTCALGTIDSWLIWKLTGGEVHRHRRHPTPAGPCCSTSAALAWSTELCDLFGVPIDALPEVAPPPAGASGSPSTEQRVRRRASRSAASPAISRRRCSARPASTRDGEEHLRHRLVRAHERRRRLPRAGRRPAHHRRLDPPGDARRRQGRRTHYASRARSSSPAQRCSGCATDSGIIDDAAEIGPLAASVDDTGGRLGRPGVHRARQPVVGSLRTGRHRRASPGARGRAAAGTGRGRVHGLPDPRRASTPWRAASGRSTGELRVDGGASVMDLLLQLQADQLGVTVTRQRSSRDHGARRRLPRRAGRGRVVDSLDEVIDRLAVRSPASSRPSRPRRMPTRATRSGSGRVERSLRLGRAGPT